MNNNAKQLFIKSCVSTLLAISVIISSILGIKAIFNYLLNLRTSSINIGQLKLDVVTNDGTSISESTLIWKNEDDEEVTIINTGETYHLDEFNLKNIGTLASDVSIKLTCDDIDILDNFDISISPSNVYLQPQASTLVNVSIKLKDDCDNSIQGKSLSNLTVVFKSESDSEIVYD